MARAAVTSQQARRCPAGLLLLSPTMPVDNIQGMLAEMDAQGAAERAVNGEGSLSEALLAVEGALELAEPAESLSDRVCRAAMLSIIGDESDPEDAEPTREDWDEHVFESVSLAWLGWLQSRDTERIRREADRLQVEAKTQKSNGAIHRLILFFWLNAVVRLVEGDREEARRLWQRALDVGSSFGTESHPVILWSYIASFWPAETPKAPNLSVQGSIGI